MTFLDKSELAQRLATLGVVQCAPSPDTWPRGLSLVKAGQSFSIECDDEHRVLSMMAGALSTVLSRCGATIVIPVDDNWLAFLGQSRWHAMGAWLANHFSAFDAAAIRFGSENAVELGMLVQHTLLFGGCTGDDLLVVSETVGAIVWLGHHGAFHVKEPDSALRTDLTSFLNARSVDYTLDIHSR